MTTDTTIATASAYRTGAIGSIGATTACATMATIIVISPLRNETYLWLILATTTALSLACLALATTAEHLSLRRHRHTPPPPRTQLHASTTWHHPHITVQRRHLDEHHDILYTETVSEWPLSSLRWSGLTHTTAFVNSLQSHGYRLADRLTETPHGITTQVHPA